MDLKLEIIGFNIESCITAQEAGADRIELCDGPGEGGTTPSYGFIKAARNKLHIELYPIIRPRGGDFLYCDEEFEIMKADVQVCKETGCDGVVTGILLADGSVDKKRCAELIRIASPMKVSFHRAFDRTNDPFRAMEDIIELGCCRILTSGQKPNATEGAELISQLIAQSNGRISIMPGSGVRSDNITALAAKTKATEFHSSARIKQESNMNYINEAMNESLSSVSADAIEIKRLVQVLNGMR